MARSLVDSALFGLYMQPAMPSQNCMVASTWVHRSLNGTDRQDRMATRQERIGAFTHEGVPPADQPLELLCEDHVGTYVVPFLCRWQSGAWQSVATSTPIEATVLGWRAP
jgi:hypothetical protein